MSARRKSKIQAMIYALLITVVVVCLSVHVTAWFSGLYDLGQRRSVLMLSMIVPLILAPPASFVYAFFAIRLIDAQSRLAALARIDPLTELLNRRAFTHKLQAEILRMARTEGPASLLMIDIDHFRDVNNTMGHNAGDAALRGVAEAMQACFRKGLDSVGRWGGEEFIVLMAETDLAGSVVAAERLRRTIEAMTIDYKGQALLVTVSVGAVSLSSDDTVDAAVARADHCLYAAKGSGRNRVVAARPTPAMIDVSDVGDPSAALSS